MKKEKVDKGFDCMKIYHIEESLLELFGLFQ